MHFTFDVDAIMPYSPSTTYDFNSSARPFNNLFDHIEPAKGQGSIVLAGEVHCPPSHLTKTFDRYEAPASPTNDSLPKSTKLQRQLSTTTTDSSGSLRTLCSQCESVSFNTSLSLDSWRWFEWSLSTDRSTRGTTLFLDCQLVSSSDSDDDDEKGTTSWSYTSNESTRSSSLVSSLLSFWAFSSFAIAFRWLSPFSPSLVTPFTSKTSVRLELGVDTVTTMNWTLLNSKRFDEVRNGILVALFNMDYNVQKVTLASVSLLLLSSKLLGTDSSSFVDGHSCPKGLNCRKPDCAFGADVNAEIIDLHGHRPITIRKVIWQPSTEYYRIYPQLVSPIPVSPYYEACWWSSILRFLLVTYLGILFICNTIPTLTSRPQRCNRTKKWAFREWAILDVRSRRGEGERERRYSL